jgi:hypothetical protein
LGNFVTIEEVWENREDNRIALILVEIDLREGLSIEMKITWGSRVFTQNLDYWKIPFSRGIFHDVGHLRKMPRKATPMAMDVVGATFFIWFKSILKVKCRFLSYFSLRDIHLLKISVVSTCEIAGDVMFHKLPLFIVKRRLLLFVPRNISLRELQVTIFTNSNVRGHRKF